MSETSKSVPLHPDFTDAVLDAVWVERGRQDAQWGEQNHDDGTGMLHYQNDADHVRRMNDVAVSKGLAIQWSDILKEEVYEAFAETDPVKLRAELVQVAAVATAWVEALDRRWWG